MDVQCIPFLNWRAGLNPSYRPSVAEEFLAAGGYLHG